MGSQFRRGVAGDSGNRAESLGRRDREARLYEVIQKEAATAGLRGGQVVLRAPAPLDEGGMVLSADGRGDPQFLHAVLCQLGLLRNPTLSKTFERRSGRAHLSLQAGRTFDGMKFVDQPLPSGTRPRLVLINVCSEAIRTRERVVDIGGSVCEFLRRLNIDPGGESMAQFRKQMLALSCCHMTLGMMTATGPAQVDAKPIDALPLPHLDVEDVGLGLVRAPPP